jgi:anti-sigma-K factor RskA
MLCRECQELASDYIDGALELGEQLQVERHLADCEGCRAVRDDLLQIVHFSRQLPLQTPSSAVWARIRNEVGIERPASIFTRARRRIASVQSRHLAISIPQLVASAAALVIVASVAVTLLRSGQNLPIDSNITTSSLVSEQSRDRLSHRDMKQYEERINALTERVEQRKGSWNSELQAAFQRNMIYVDQSLVECRNELADNPGDDVSRELMLTAYREKVRLLEGFDKF